MSAAGGSLTANLKELCEAGFVAKDEGLNPVTRSPTKLARYRVSDNYTRFYLKYIEPHEAEIRSGRFVFSSLAALEGWQADMGHQFENLIVNNVRQLVPHFHLDWSRVLSAAPFEIRCDIMVMTWRESNCRGQEGYNGKERRESTAEPV